MRPAMQRIIAHFVAVPTSYGEVGVRSEPSRPVTRLPRKKWELPQSGQ